ncbi:PH domain-containing protein [Spirosoma linguale]|uniref:Membrane-flanked domain protein n=1 Tax=Spirosoma linguale (strain ATCC 33905 / DSM 74 / LMG 10896 / Claus 1) TaxID=504472 RepID=D2QFA2_SPILD|nr:membrane-flanked domain protein [Spirosoma linguale DSM 74]
MVSPEPALPLKASFNPIIRTYLLLYVSFFLLISIVGILLLPFWLLGVGQWWSQHYFNNLECELSERSLRFKKGILVQVEKTIPLENIQDVTFVAGPILRYFDLCILKFETAGQSQHQANDMELIGIIDAQAFRTHIIELRQKLMSAKTTHQHATTGQDVLIDIRDTLRDIKQLLQTQQNANRP